MKFLAFFVALWVTNVVADDGSSSSYSSSSGKALGSNLFVDSESTYYDGYQQAWRYLGWYVKCGSPSDRYSNQQHHSHSGDSSNEEEINHYCQRFLIWAAYVDENYQGGGIGEYSYYNATTQSWDNSACKAHGNGRCAPMDCHENNSTTWKLMGVFKEASYFGNDAFFEQLFKHEGVCVWNDDNLYSFMSTARKNYWPTGCISTGIKITNTYSNDYGSYLYIDLRPTWNGNMTYGLYSDEICKTEYDLPDKDIDSITKSMGLLYGSYLQKWNDGLEAFKVCQPCKAYNLKNNYASSNYYGSYSDSSDPNAGYFQCYDDADYTNVNQCMKFRTHAQLEVCTWEDLVTATNQGGILEVKVGDTVFGSERMSAEEYKYLMKAQKESNLKASKAEAQTVAMYRREAEKVAAMKPSANRWNALGGLTLAMGTMFLFGSVFWIGKGYIDRAFPKKTLVEPLLPPSRDFLGKELAENTTSQPSIPFGNGSDDEESVVNRPDLLDDNTSVSSLSYTSAMQDPTKAKPTNDVPDALDAWYSKIEDDSTKETSLAVDSGANIKDEQKLKEYVCATKSDAESVDSSVFDGVEAPNEVHNIHRSHPIGDCSREEEEATLDSECVYMDVQGITERNVVVSVDPVFSVDSSPEERPEGTTPEIDDYEVRAAGAHDDEDGIPCETPESDDKNVPDSLFTIEDSDIPDPVKDDDKEAPKSGIDDVPDSEIAVDDSDTPAITDAHDGEVKVDEIPCEESESEDKNAPDSLFTIDVEDDAGDKVVCDTIDSSDNATDDANEASDILDSVESKSNIEDSQEVTADADTARISNVSLNECFEQDKDLPDEMIQYLSMSTSEQSNIQEDEIETGEQLDTLVSQRAEVNEEEFDDTTEEPPSI